MGIMILLTLKGTMVRSRMPENKLTFLTYTLHNRIALKQKF
jgi:hypothetical protein